MEDHAPERTLPAFSEHSGQGFWGMAGEDGPDKPSCPWEPLGLSGRKPRKGLGIQGLSSPTSTSFLVLKGVCMKPAAEPSRSPAYAGLHVSAHLRGYTCAGFGVVCPQACLVPGHMRVCGPMWVVQGCVGAWVCWACTSEGLHPQARVPSSSASSPWPLCPFL